MRVIEMTPWKDCNEDNLLLMRQLSRKTFETVRVRKDVLDETIMHIRHEVIFLDDYLKGPGMATLEGILANYGYSGANGAYAAFCDENEEDERESTLALFIADDRGGSYDEDSAELLASSATEAARFVYDLTGLEYDSVCGEPVDTDASAELKDITIRKATCCDCCNFSHDDEASEDSGEDCYCCDACGWDGCNPDADAFEADCGKYMPDCYDKTMNIFAIGKGDDGKRINLGFYIIDGISSLGFGYKDAIIKKIKETFPDLTADIIDIEQ